MHGLLRYARVTTLVLTLAVCGCAGGEYLQIRRVPRNPLAGPLQLLSWSGPSPSDRTQLLLRKYALRDLFDSNPSEALRRLRQEIETDPAPDKVYAYAELAYVVGHRADLMGNKDKALNHYGAAVAHAYLYLFDSRFERERNHYDPQFRGACDVYNAGLEGVLRITSKAGLLKPGTTQKIAVGDHEYAVQIVVRGAWRAEEIERLEFTSEFEVRGLNNRHHTFGLGVPLIAVRRGQDRNEPTEQFYAPGLSFPVSAFLRVAQRDANGDLYCMLELHDPLASNTVQVANHIVPLETDVSTALAHFLDQDHMSNSQRVATLGLLYPNEAETLKGLYMLEPYDPNRIPVIMVHGLWSSPLTWMEMFNDLRSFPELRENFQFWFYLYPTGHPFWVSAANFRSDLAQAQALLDPYNSNPKMQQIALVGHSMGGLVSRMQAVDSGERFWNIVSDKPFSELDATKEEREKLERVLFFRPNPALRRVITIATPHGGSDFANDYTRWLGRQFIAMPDMLLQSRQAILARNPGLFRSEQLLNIDTSIDSLAPESPILPVLRSSPVAPWIKHHNIVGVADNDGFINSFSGEGDGVVESESAHFEGADSEIVANATHSTVHQHPRTILEVRRVLLEHLGQYHHERAQAANRARVFNGIPSNVPGPVMSPQSPPYTRGPSLPDATQPSALPNATQPSVFPNATHPPAPRYTTDAQTLNSTRPQVGPPQFPPQAIRPSEPPPATMAPPQPQPFAPIRRN